MFEKKILTKININLMKRIEIIHLLLYSKLELHEMVSIVSLMGEKEQYYKNGG